MNKCGCRNGKIGSFATYSLLDKCSTNFSEFISTGFIKWQNRQIFNKFFYVI